MKTTKQLQTLILSLSAVGVLVGLASPAVAQENSDRNKRLYWYKTDMCGDGITQSADIPAEEGCTAYDGAPTPPLFYCRDVKTTPLDPPNNCSEMGGASIQATNGTKNVCWSDTYYGLSRAAIGSSFHIAPDYYYDGEWPENLGEMCDPGNPERGIKPTVALCGQDKSKKNYNACKILDSGTWGCYENKTCGQGVGNGIIQPASPYNEQCDDGNTIDGDGCSRWGKIENAEKFIDGVCGNGIIETIDGKREQCDDGNIRNGDGCSSECTIEPAQNGTPVCTLKDVCGNGRIDSAFGEQCDATEEECDNTCLYEGSPRFDKENTAWWPAPKGGKLYLDLPPSDNLANNPELVTLGGGSDPGDVFKTKVKIELNGQKVSVPRNDGTQYQFSGVFLTGQKIEDIAKYSKFKDGTIHFSMVIRPTDTVGGANRWDDDAIGIVFGMQPGDQEEYAKTHPDYQYLMLSWRSYMPFGYGGNVITPGCNGNPGPQAGGSVGPRLYQIKGAPSYQQLWTMRGNAAAPNDFANPKRICSSKNGDLMEIITSSPGGTGPAQGNYGQEAWTHGVYNPFLSLNTFYAYDFGVGQANENQRLQIDVEFSLTELKVWVNKQVAIDIKRHNIETFVENQSEDGYLKDFKWPTLGELGFYLLAMDNISVDVSGYYSSANQADIDKIAPQQGGGSEGAKSTVCGAFCGDGIKNGDENRPEVCDDGNKDDSDGCTSKCTFTDPNGDNNLCSSIKDGNKIIDQQCYGGSITSPLNDSTVGTQTPTIKGTYTGDPAEIKVTILDEDGTEKCTGNAVTKADGTWSFDTSSCNLEDAKKYTAKVGFVPKRQSTQGNNFPILEEDTSFSVDTSKPSIVVDMPKGSPVFVAKDKKLTASGSAQNADKVKVTVCPKGEATDCTDVPVVYDQNTGNWTAETTGPSGLDPSKEYTLKFVAKKNGPPEETVIVERPLKVVDYGLSAPEITSPALDKVIPNPDGTITVEGKETIPTECRKDPSVETSPFDSSKCPQISVTITNTNCSSKAVSVTVPVDADGSYRGDLPLCDNQEANQTVDISVKATDAAGNVSDPSDTKRVTLTERVTPKIQIKCPQATSKGDKCKLLNGDTSSGLVVNGESNVRSERPVTVTAYKKKENEKCDFGDLGKAVETVHSKTTPDGKWAVDFKHLGSGDYCIVADLDLSKDDSNPRSTTTAKGYERGPLTAPKFVKNKTGITEEIINARDESKTTIDVDLEAGGNSVIIEGDKCVVTVNGSDTWKSNEGTFAKEGDKFVCKVDMPICRNGGTECTGDDSLVGKTLVAKALPKEGAGGEESGPTEERLPSATLSADGDRGKIALGEGYPAKAGDTVTFKNSDGTEVGTCTLKNAADGSGGLECTTENPLAVSPGTTTTVSATITPSGEGDPVAVPAAPFEVTGETRISITGTCVASNASCSVAGSNTSGKGLVVNGSTNAPAGKTVTVKAYPKGAAANCDDMNVSQEAAGEGTYTIPSPSSSQDKSWGIDFKHLPPRTYCVVSEVGSDGSKVKAGPEEVNYTRSTLTGEPSIAEDGPTIAKKVLEAAKTGGTTIPVKVTVPADSSNIAVGDECVVTVNGDDGWEGKGTFSKDGDHYTCTAQVPITNPTDPNDSLLGKNITAKATGPSGNGGAPLSSGESNPVKIPGAHMEPEGDGVKITFDPDYPGITAGTTSVSIKDGTTEVGTCTVENENGTLVCKAESLVDNGTKLTGKTSPTTVVPYIGNNRIPGLEAEIPPAGTPGKPTIDGGDATEIAKKIIDAKKNSEATIQVSVTVPNNENVADEDTCEVMVKGKESTWKAKGSFSNGTCNVDMSIEEDGESLLGKTLVAKVTKKDNPSNSSSGDLKIPGSTTTILPDGKIQVTFDDGYPGTTGDTAPSVTFDNGSGTPLSGSCTKDSSTNETTCTSDAAIPNDTGSPMTVTPELGTGKNAIPGEEVKIPGMSIDGAGSVTMNFGSNPGDNSGKPVTFKQNGKEVGHCTIDAQGVCTTKLAGAAKGPVTATIEGKNVAVANYTPETKPGSNLVGPSNTKGTISVNADGSVTVSGDDLPDGTVIHVTVKRDGVDDTTVECTVGADHSCTTAPITGMDGTGDEKVMSVVATKGSGNDTETIDTWFPKPGDNETPEPAVQPTVTYVGGENSNKVVITIPKENAPTLDKGKTVKVTSEDGTVSATCQVKDSGKGYWWCVSTGPFVKSGEGATATRFTPSDKVDVAKVDTSNNNSVIPIGTAYIGSNVNTPTVEINSEGKGVVTIPDGYPVPVSGKIEFKVGNDVVGSCNLPNPLPATGPYTCTSTKPLKNGDAKLASGTTVTANSGGVTLGSGTVPAVPDQPATPPTNGGTGSYTEEDGKITVTIPAQPGAATPTPGNVTITNSGNGKPVGTCTTIKQEGDQWVCVVNNPTNLPGDGGNIEATVDGKKFTVEPAFSSGVIAGGCSSTPTNTSSGILSFLLALLGLVGIRRRRS